MKNKLLLISLEESDNGHSTGLLNRDRVKAVCGFESHLLRRYKIMKEQPEKSFEREIDPRSIVIVTGTLYPTWGTENERDVDRVRGGLALQTLKRAKQKGYQIVLRDDGSSRAFLEELDRKGVVPRGHNVKGMSANRQQSFEDAGKLEGAQVICWTEPEKVSLVGNCLPEAVRSLLDGRADIVVPKRDPEAWKTYPQYQAESERRLIRLWNAILKEHGVLPKDTEDLDVFFGPKFFRNDPDLLKIFLESYEFKKRDLKLDELVEPGRWANAIFFPIIKALAEGYRVMSVPVPYRNPAEQTNLEKDSNEFRRKRKVQFKDLITNTIHFIRLLEQNPKSRLHKVGRSP